MKGAPQDWPGLESALLGAIQQAVIATDPAGRVMYWNPFAERLYGWTATEALGASLARLIVPESELELGKQLGDAVRAGASWSGEFMARRRDGTLLPTHLSLSPIARDDGSFAGAVGISEDARERQRVQADRERLAAIVTSSDDAIVALGLDGVITNWNPGAERLYGYTAAEMMANPPPSLVPEERRGEIRELVERLRRGERVQHIETQRVRKDGTLVDVSISMSPLRDARGALVAIAAISRDITPQKASQRQLQEAERRIRSLFTYHPDAVFELDADACYVDLNPACELISGTPPQALLGKPMGDRTSDPDLTGRSLQTAMSGRPVTYETKMITPDGRRVPVQVTLVPIVVDGKTVGVYGITKDVSEWKRVEHMLATHARQQTAIADLGLLALTDIDMQMLLKTAVDIVGPLLNVESVALLDFVPETCTFRLRHGAQLPESFGENSISNSTFRSVLESAECIRISARELQMPEGCSGLATGIPGREHAHGLLLAWTPHARWFSDDDLTFLKEVANVLGAAIDNNTAADELRRRESELKILVETTSDNIVRFDRELRYVYANPAVERLVGKPASTLIGKRMPDLAAAIPQVGIWERALRRVFRSGEEDELEARYGDRHYHVRLSPEFGPDGEIKSVLGVGRDVTANQQREAERARIYQELLERDSRLHQLVERVLLHQQEPKHKQHAAADQFNSRERQILQLLARGLTNREIAREVNLRPSTVKNYVASMLPRLNATDRTHAAVVAAQLGLLDGDDGAE